MEPPAIIWADGIAPTSPLEDHPFVQTLRGAELGWKMAWNTGDFTIKQLTDNVPAWSVASYARQYADQGLAPTMYLTIATWQPIEIIEDRGPEGGGRVAVCKVPVMASPLLPGGLQYDRTESYTSVMEVFYEEGRLRTVPTIGGGGTYKEKTCDGGQVPIGIFDPAPTEPPTPVTEPVRPPLYPGWEEPDAFF